MNLVVNDDDNEQVSSLTIHLPSDNDLTTYNTEDNPWVFVDGYEDRYYSTCNEGFYYTGERTSAVNLEVEGSYDYKLIGWVDIATGKHYDVTYGSTDAVIENDGLNHVFYAEWIANDYNNALTESTDIDSLGGIKDTVDTSNFVSIEMFDYNEIFNLYSATINKSDGAKSENWKDSGTFYNSLVGDKTDETAAFESDTNTTFVFNNDATNTAGNIGNISNRSTYGNNQWYSPTSTKLNGTIIYDLIYAFPDVADDTQSNHLTEGAENGILQKLFDDTNSTLGTYYVSEGNYLFSYENTNTDAEHYGYYYYSSTTNAAAYQQSEGRFYVYNKRQEAYNGSTSSATYYDGIFLPYNKPDNSQNNAYGYNSHSIHSAQINYWFGMKMETSFYLPEDVGTDSDPTNKIRGDNMVFEFSGDDDVWIFVDDTLVMDLTGIHDKTECTINFSTGEVSRDLSEYANKRRSGDTSDIYNFYYQSSNGTNQSNNGGFVLSSLSGLAAGDHTLTIYYLERGAYASNLTISFNIVPHWYYDLLEVVTTSITKEWELPDGTLISGKNLKNIGLDLEAEVGLFAKTTEEQYTKVGEEYPLIYDETEQKWYYYADFGDENDLENNPVVRYEVQDDGWIYDDSGVVVGFFTENEEIAKTMQLDTGTLYLFVDEQTLSSANNWQYTWAILSSTSDYVVLEMNSTGGYHIASTEVEALTDWVYWKIIGASEINGMYEQHVNNSTDYTYTIRTVDGSTDIPILLTDAGFNEKSSTEDITGEVLTHEVSHAADFGGLYREYYPISSAPSGSFYGVYSDSVIGYMNPLNPECSAVWYLEYAKTEVKDDTLSSQQEEEFFIYCLIDNNKYYLTEKAWEDETITDGSDTYIPEYETHHLELTHNKDNAMKMYYSTVGELIIVPDNYNDSTDEDKNDSLEKIVITSSGYVQITSAYIAQDDPYNIRIYVLDTVKTTGYIYTIKNKEITYELPSTGGNIFIVWGVGIAVVLVGSTGVVLVRRGRRSRKR